MIGYHRRASEAPAKKQLEEIHKQPGHRTCEDSLSHNWTGSRRDFWLVSKCSWSKYLSEASTPTLTYDIPFLRHVTSNKTYDFCMFSKFVNFAQLISKSVHIDWTYIMYHTKKCTNQNNVTRVFMANTGWIFINLRMEIPVLHAYVVWQPIYHRSKVKVIKHIKTTVWAITNVWLKQCQIPHKHVIWLTL